MERKKHPIRVLQVVTNMNRGGLETMLMNYYRHIDRTKVQFDFLTHRQERAAYDDEIEALGGRIYRLPRLIPWSKHYLSALNVFFAEHPEYTIIHVHQDCLSSVVLRIAAKHGVPVRIAHSHNANQDRDIKYLVKLFCMRSIPKYATHLFACSTAAGDWMFNGAPYQLFANAVDTADFSFSAEKAAKTREKLGIGKNVFAVGHIGRFSAQKNHTFLIDVFAKIIEKEPDSRLLLIGNGGRLEEIKGKVKALNLPDKVIFTGIRTDIPDLLQAMDVFVLPSLYEGLPVTLVEAQAAGLPCVISDKVSEECIVTKGLVTKMNLSDAPIQWAEHILNLRGTARINRYEEVRASGYDIVSCAKKLERFYLEQAENV